MGKLEAPYVMAEMKVVLYRRKTPPEQEIGVQLQSRDGDVSRQHFAISEEEYQQARADPLDWTMQFKQMFNSFIEAVLEPDQAKSIKKVLDKPANAV